MRTILFIFLLTTIIASTKGQTVYVNLIDASGKQIRGEVYMKGFERCMQALTTSSGAKNNMQFSYTMNVCGAAADLKRSMQNGELLLTGLVTIMQPRSQTMASPMPAYTIKMEKIKVLSCSENMGCNNLMTTTVMLQATRIGWTYYQPDRYPLTVSNKYGYDAEAGGAWTNF